MYTIWRNDSINRNTEWIFILRREMEKRARVRPNLPSFFFFNFIFNFFLIRYFLHLHFQCYPKSPPIPSPNSPHPPTPTFWPWCSPVKTIIHPDQVGFIPGMQGRFNIWKAKFFLSSQNYPDIHSILSNNEERELQKNSPYEYIC
jgi:hypothetical protein